MGRGCHLFEKLKAAWVVAWWCQARGEAHTRHTVHGTHKDAHVLEDKMRRDGCDGNPRRGESRAGGTKAARSHMLWWWQMCGEKSVAKGAHKHSGIHG